ncbi:MAG: hypothetical protein IPL03_00795 [Sterolibacteriaceae bacterium]|nr:hypothetical protein [Candidatus Methylophosphatis haderslevensis]
MQNGVIEARMLPQFAGRINRCAARASGVDGTTHARQAAPSLPPPSLHGRKPHRPGFSGMACLEAAWNGLPGDAMLEKASWCGFQHPLPPIGNRRSRPHAIRNARGFVARAARCARSQREGLAISNKLEGKPIRGYVYHVRVGRRLPKSAGNQGG